jgi:hypothetical protein
MSRTPATDRRIMGGRSPILLFPQPATTPNDSLESDAIVIAIAEFLADQDAREILAEDRAMRQIKEQR